MCKGKIEWYVLAVAGIVLGLVLSGTKVQAVPSLARQTGMDCSACHTVFPQLTPFGRNFKLTGYTISKDTKKKYEWPPPLAGMTQTCLTHTSKYLPADAVPKYQSANDNWNLQAVSIFYAGRIYGSLGMFTQGTYDGVERQFFLDNTDIRFAKTTKLFDKNLIYGITLNNNPTAQDVLNTTPAWGFPFASSPIAPTPAAATLIEGGLAQLAAGGGVYAYWNDLLYLEATFYTKAYSGPFAWLGLGHPVPAVTVLNGVAPYWRAFLYHQWKKHNIAVGTFGLVANVFPDGQSRGPSNRFVDVGFDVQYQYIGVPHLITIRSTFIQEWQTWGASNNAAIGDTQNLHNSLNTYKINGSYYYRTKKYGTIGGSIGYFLVGGSADNILYAPDSVEGSKNALPNSNGFIFEADYLPQAPLDRIKLALQYTVYNQFNGRYSNYDGFGRNASGNNTLYFLVWVAY